MDTVPSITTTTADSADDGVVIRATQLTQQEHVCRPGTDPTNRGQLSMCLVVCQLAQPVKIEATVECAHRQVPQRRSLGGRQANRAELGIGSTGASYLTANHICDRVNADTAVVPRTWATKRSSR